MAPFRQYRVGWEKPNGFVGIRSSIAEASISKRPYKAQKLRDLRTQCKLRMLPHTGNRRALLNSLFYDDTRFFSNNPFIAEIPRFRYFEMIELSLLCAQCDLPWHGLSREEMVRSLEAMYAPKRQLGPGFETLRYSANGGGDGSDGGGQSDSEGHVEVAREVADMIVGEWIKTKSTRYWLRRPELLMRMEPHLKDKTREYRVRHLRLDWNVLRRDRPAARALLRDGLEHTRTASFRLWGHHSCAIPEARGSSIKTQDYNLPNEVNGRVGSTVGILRQVLPHFKRLEALSLQGYNKMGLSERDFEYDKDIAVDSYPQDNTMYTPSWAFSRLLYRLPTCLNVLTIDTIGGRFWNNWQGQMSDNTNGTIGTNRNFANHLCHDIARIAPRMRILRLRLQFVCDRIFAWRSRHDRREEGSQMKRGTWKDSRLELLVVNFAARWETEPRRCNTYTLVSLRCGVDQIFDRSLPSEVQPPELDWRAYQDNYRRMVAAGREFLVKLRRKSSRPLKHLKFVSIKGKNRASFEQETNLRSSDLVTGVNGWLVNGGNWEDEPLPEHVWPNSGPVPPLVNEPGPPPGFMHDTFSMSDSSDETPYPRIWPLDVDDRRHPVGTHDSGDSDDDDDPDSPAHPDYIYPDCTSDVPSHDSFDEPPSSPTNPNTGNTGNVGPPGNTGPPGQPVLKEEDPDDPEDSDTSTVIGSSIMDISDQDRPYSSIEATYLARKRIAKRAGLRGKKKDDAENPDDPEGAQSSDGPSDGFDPSGFDPAM